MLNTQFVDKLDFDIYCGEQEARMKLGYLTRSERIELNKMLDEKYKPTFIKEKIINPNIKSIITDINLLRKPCIAVEKGEDITSIIKDLKETLGNTNGVGLSAPQIGIAKQVSYIKIPKVVDKKIEFTEIILINPKIIEHSRKMIVKGEQCLSMPNLKIDTDRWCFITMENHNEKLESQLFMSQDWEAITIQHECDHLQGKLIIDRKHKAK